MLTKTGTANAVLPIRYLADSPFTIYLPGRPQDADTQHKYQSKDIPTGISNPTMGLFSNTAASKNATADKSFNDGVNDVIQGRRPPGAEDLGVDLEDRGRRRHAEGVRGPAAGRGGATPR